MGDAMVEQQTIGNAQFYKPNWADSRDVHKWLNREVCLGTTLNFPCGNSPVGDVRAERGGTIVYQVFQVSTRENGRLENYE
jgi:hypothetical protein